MAGPPSGWPLYLHPYPPRPPTYQVPGLRRSAPFRAFSSL